VFFGGVGDVASGVSKFTISAIKPSYDAGTRFRIDELQKLDLLGCWFWKKYTGFLF